MRRNPTGLTILCCGVLFGAAAKGCGDDGGDVLQTKDGTGGASGMDGSVGGTGGQAVGSGGTGETGGTGGEATGGAGGWETGGSGETGGAGGVGTGGAETGGSGGAETGGSGGAETGGSGGAAGSTLPGETCENPIVIPPPDATTTSEVDGDSTNYSDEYSIGCGAATGLGSGAPDVVLSFTPSVTGRYEYSIEGLSWSHCTYWRTTCDQPDSCTIGQGCGGPGGGERGSTTLSADTPVFLFVDGWTPAPNTGPFHVSIGLAPDCQPIGALCVTDSDCCSNHCPVDWGLCAE